MNKITINLPLITSNGESLGYIDIILKDCKLITVEYIDVNGCKKNINHKEVT